MYALHDLNDIYTINPELDNVKFVHANRFAVVLTKKDQPPSSKNASGSSITVLMILGQLRDCTPSVYLMSCSLRD